MNSADHNTIVGGACSDSSEEKSQTRGVKPARVIVNADDWGRDGFTTDRILECIQQRVVSSTSAMVFMEDSARAAELASEHYVDTGLHLNFTARYTALSVPTRLQEHQERLARFLKSHRLAPVIFSPLLMRSFDYVTKAQIDEYQRLYGVWPNRFDGHHHRHLAMNMLWQNLIPDGTIVRRNFTFAPGEKGAFNRWFREHQDHRFARHHRLTDYLFNLVPLEDRDRLRRILELSREANVELETHPAVPKEFEFLMRGELQRCAENVEVARGFQLHTRSAIQTKVEPVAKDVHAVRHADAQPPAISGRLPHICVCICTYKRPEPLRRLLSDLDRQATDGLFTFSIVVADNDPLGTGRAVVEEMQKTLHVPVKYCVEPERGIARARNRVVANAEGDYLAWIDDDEFPEPGWLKTLYVTCRRYDVDGVLGPVKRYFDHEPPHWLKTSKLYDRPVNPTGMQVEWRESRTGNVIIRRELVANDPAPFRPQFRAGEDQDFFRRKMEEGRTFVWSADAIAYEVIPPARWKRMYYVRKALLQGATAALRPDCGPRVIAKSVIAVPLYTLGLPFALLAGQHRFMTLLVKLCDHAGKLLQLMKINPVREEYVSD